MDYKQASLIAELIVNAGYADDADEIYSDMLEHNKVPSEQVRQHAIEMDKLINQVNGVLPEDERLQPTNRMIEEVEAILKR